MTICSTPPYLPSPNEAAEPDRDGRYVGGNSHLRACPAGPVTLEGVGGVAQKLYVGDVLAISRKLTFLT